ncbi:MAG: DNA-processing protein DprA, partial [Clostridiales bacterium]|nr:DNA-processing protein DprA [Clostridiales bacterium]
FHDILQEGGCIISEYSPETKADSKKFPDRNRIVSGLSEGVLVVEARYRSGTSITAGFAKKQGKKIFCIPSNVDLATGYGTGVLIQEGAKLVLTPEDILQDFGINLSKEIEFKEEKNIEVDKEYKEVYETLSNIPINTNEIAKRINKSVREVNVKLTMLELQGLIKQVGINEFVKI